MAEYLLPDVGEGLTEAEIVSWKVKEGDTVAINEVIVEIEQIITATKLTKDEAGLLGSEDDSAALRIIRRYYATGRRLVEISANLYPASRFSHLITLRRDGTWPTTP